MVCTVAAVTLMATAVFAARVEVPVAEMPILLEKEEESLESEGRRRRPDGKPKRKKNRAKQMQLESLHIENKCVLPVYFFEGQSKSAGPVKIEAGDTVVFTGDEPDLRLDQRLTFSYGTSQNSGEANVIELGRGFAKFHEPVKHFNFNFINQNSFLDLNLHMSLWKDEIDGELACEDGRAQTAFKMTECEQADGSAKIVERETPEGEIYHICEAKYKPTRDEQNRAEYKPEACTADYARYVNAKSVLFQPAPGSDMLTGSWVASADSVGVDHHGFKHAKMSDGSTKASTLTGRDGDGVAVNKECFEFPCGKDKDGACKANGHVAAGNIGFAKCSYNGPVAKFGVMQVVLCPDPLDTTDAQPDRA